mgnify:FL=1
MNRPSSRRQADRIDRALQWGFYILAFGSVVAFFTCRDTTPRLFQILGLAAIVVRVLFYLKLLVYTKKG